MPYWRVFGLVATGLNRTDHDLPAINADAYLNRRATLLLELAAIASKLLLHSDRRVERALGMVLVSDWCAEQRKNAVAGRLDDIAIVMAHCFNHQFERWVYNCPRLLRVEVLHQLSRAFYGE